MARLDAGFITRACNGGVAKGRYRDGGGLILNVSEGGASWLLRYQLNGRRRDAGLGPLNQVGLSKARELAAGHLLALKANRVDPIAHRQEERARAAASVTFDKAAAGYIDEHKAGWKNAKHIQQWQNTLATYASPQIGKLAVNEITTDHVLQILRPLWSRIPITGDRVRGRIEVILDYAKARGFRSGENPARWRGHIALMLPNKAKLKATRHHPAVPVDALPGVYRNLAKTVGVAASAVRFTILTAARPGEVTGATWDEIDAAAKVWTVPPHRQKAGKRHSVPLCDESLALLGEVAPLREGSHALVFPGARKGRPLSVATLSNLLRLAGGGKTTLHGTARSTFDDWGSERTHHAQKLIDRALAHGPKSKTVAAYRRSELLEQRRLLMSDWARFLSGK